MLMPLFSIILLCIICIIIASASLVDDRCSKDIPCTPSDIDGDPFFCDYQIGPTAGGYFVACEGRQVSIYYDCAYHVNIH